MSTNTSQNLGLHLWEPTDQVLRTEFNQNWTKLDTAVNTAQETAEAAQDTADAAQTAATAVSDAYTPSNKPYVTGSYTGTGASVTITLGFQPSFLIISGMVSSTNYSDVEEWANFFALCNGSVLSKRVAFTATGFTAKAQGPGADYYPNLTDSGRTYCYIAFR